MNTLRRHGCNNKKCGHEAVVFMVGKKTMLMVGNCLKSQLSKSHHWRKCFINHPTKLERWKKNTHQQHSLVKPKISQMRGSSRLFRRLSDRMDQMLTVEQVIHLALWRSKAIHHHFTAAEVETEWVFHASSTGTHMKQEHPEWQEHRGPTVKKDFCFGSPPAHWSGGHRVFFPVFQVACTPLELARCRRW